MKKCSVCGETKPIEDFHPDRVKPTGVRHCCKACTSDQNRAAYEARRYNRDGYLRRTYGISEAEFNRLMKAQNGGCALCGSGPTANRKYLSVDHCHETQLVRGLLCQNCNTSLGKLGDSIESVERLLAYVKAPIEALGHVGSMGALRNDSTVNRDG